MLLLLISCGDDGSDTGLPSCDDQAEAPYSFPEGTWEMSVDEVDDNGCENDAGNGLHLNIGTLTDVDLSQGSGDCLSGEEQPSGPDEPAMAWEGTLSGTDDFDLGGFVEIVMGTCVWGIEAEMTGTVESDDTLTYAIDATVVVVREGGYLEEGGEWLDIDGACDLIVGDTSAHTFPEMPCDASWSGAGSLK